MLEATPEKLVEINKEIGKRIRMRRHELNLTQTVLGQRMNLTFQQIQKYEIGMNKISAARVVIFSQALEIGIDYFYTAPIKEGV